jgi:hypothetical protein
MPEKTVKRRLQGCDAALASDDGTILLDRRQAGRERMMIEPREV